ncbi:Ldh family oxidoreductase [Pseudogemmobacter sonorensis]|uniref:Ldh family oxidoreductase n=1 Tax=Pseudogemmobacter sonorensis TaxID=2989681 RepID=UPI0036AA5447
MSHIMTTQAVTDHGLTALVMCPGYATVVPTGGVAALLGANPFAFRWPRRDNPPYVFDFATSVAARGEIELHRRAAPLPEGRALDVAGRPTSDPEAALLGAMLPFVNIRGPPSAR